MKRPSTAAQSIEATRVNLDVALLRTFVAVVDLGGVARAAQRVGRSQPAVSLQLRRLEDVTGAPLFQKNGRGLALTDGGDVLLSYARRLLELNDETVTAVTTLRLAGSVRLGISQDFADGWLTKILARFGRAHPSIVIEVKADRNAVLLDALARQKLDFALTFGEKNTRGAIDLGRVPMVWIGTNERSWQSADRVPLVVFEPPCEFRRVAVQALEAKGVPWRLAFSSPSLSSQWSAVEAGLGVTMRTPIGLRSPLIVLGDQDGLPPLPSGTLRLLLHHAEGKQSAAARKLQEILITTIREKLEADIGHP
ncbi:MAG TPA: LysR substrate-binding domain-containing protein [Vineibacter sp.]|nr:LysR substrate-binding domain-containing protein [Vineibacter sp.]